MDFIESTRLSQVSEPAFSYSPENLQAVKDALGKLIATHSVPLLIAIDGRGAVGKETVKRSFEELGYQSFSFGEFARVLSWYFLRFGYSAKDLGEFYQDIKELVIKTGSVNGKRVVEVSIPGAVIFNLELEGTDYYNGLRSPEVEEIVSQISGLPEVVEHINTLLQTMVGNAHQSNNAFVSEGRDHWKIFDRQDAASPAWYQAMLLIYLTADDTALRQRAIKRAEEKVGRPLKPAEAQQVGDKLLERNEQDSQRAIGRLLSQEEAEKMGIYDAIVDSSEFSPEETLFAIALLQLQKAELLRPTSTKSIDQPVV